MPPAPLNLGELLLTALPVSLRHIPYRLRDVAHELQQRVALAGGVPRDLLRLSLGQIDRYRFHSELRDFDVVVEGDGVRFAYELVRRLPGRLTVNQAFHTASLLTGDPLRLDITSARLDSYPASGHLPVVDVSGVSIEEDLQRRDFSINALALDLSHDFGQLIDTCGGAGDVREQWVRVLHGASFSDDPTRLLRALRYSLRLNYNLEPVTLAQYQSAIDDGALDNLTPERIRYELECIGSEPRWAEAWAVMDLSGLAKALAPQLGGISRDFALEDAAALDIAIRNQEPLLKREELEPWLVRTAWVLASAPWAHFEGLSARLGIYPTQQRWLATALEVIHEQLRRLLDEMRPSAITRLLERYPRQGVVLALMIYQPRSEDGVEVRKKLLRYVEVYSEVRGELTGHNLIALGVPAGPALGELRNQLRYMRLDGVITDAAGEREYAKEYLARLGPDSAGGPPVEPKDDEDEN